MNKNEIICIERTENGFIVRPEYHTNQIVTPSLWLVFNEMGFASSCGESGSTPCLLKFIEGHFTEGKGTDHG